MSTAGSAQLCSTQGCTEPVVFRTRQRPSWCSRCLTGIFRDAGLRALETPTRYDGWVLTDCLSCSTEAHYRLSYVLDQTAKQIATCRACYWTQWAHGARLTAGADDTSPPVDNVDEARRHAEANGYEYLRPLTSPSLPDDPHHVRCRSCRRLSAERLSDIAWGCACSRNTRSAAPVRKTKVALADSGSPALCWWDHDRNDTALLASLTLKARRVVAWCCPACGHRFAEAVYAMTDQPACPSCTERRHQELARQRAEWARTPVSAIPELANTWADEADPDTVMVADGWARRFRCPEGHHPRISPATYLGSGCPSCRGLTTQRQGSPSLAQALSEITSQWHPDRNGTLTPTAVGPGSKRKVWWRDPNCGHEWQAPVAHRDKYRRYRCPRCRTVLDSLAWQFPTLAAEWAPENPLTAWHVRPTAQTEFVPTWVCSIDPAHRWQAPLASRTAGSECPECREAGKSRVELAHREAAVAAFGAARSGAVLRATQFRHRPAWTVDIFVLHAGDPEDRPLVIEYDGAYWHAGEVKRAVDLAKSSDLIDAGYLVVRLREAPLVPLEIDHPRYVELLVSSTTPRPAPTVQRIQQWVACAPGSRH